MITQLDTENADFDLTSIQTVLTDTPDVTNPMLCQILLAIGDGSKDLDASGGTFEITININGVPLQPSPTTQYFAAVARVMWWSDPFPVPANMAVTIQLESPNGADTDVDVTAYLYEVGVSAASVNAEVDTGISDAALATAANLTTVDTVVDAIKVTTDKLDDTLEDDGGTYRFTENALEEAPSGGDATAANQVLLLEDIADVKGTGFVKDTNSLVNVSARSTINWTIEATVTT